MKVTALIPDDLVKRIREETGGKNITESLILALNEYLSFKKIMALDQHVQEKPLEFREEFSASKIRKISRQR